MPTKFKLPIEDMPSTSNQQCIIQILKLFLLWVKLQTFYSIIHESGFYMYLWKFRNHSSTFIGILSTSDWVSHFQLALALNLLSMYAKTGARGFENEWKEVERVGGRDLHILKSNFWMRVGNRFSFVRIIGLRAVLLRI